MNDVELCRWLNVLAGNNTTADGNVTTVVMLSILILMMEVPKVEMVVPLLMTGGSRELKQLRRRPQQRLQKTIGLMIKTTAQHVHHAF